MHVVSPVRHGGGESLITDLVRSAETDPLVVLYYRSVQFESVLTQYKIRWITLTQLSLGDGTRLSGSAIRAAFGVSCVRRLLRSIQREAPDVIHVHSFPGSFLIATFKSLRLIDTPALLTRHSLHARHTPVGRRLFRWMMSQYECTSTVSNASKASMEAAFGALEVRVVHNCVADEFFRVPMSKPADRWVFLQLGRFMPAKNHGLVLDALLRRRPEERSKIAVWFAGAGETEALVRAKTQRLGLLPEEVKFLGFIPHHQLPNIMMQTHFGLFPSTSEGFGIGAAECLAAGRPVLALQTDVMREVVGPGGICVPADQLDEGFREMIASGSTMSGAARRWANRYRPAHIRSEYTTLYRVVMERAP